MRIFQLKEMHLSILKPTTNNLLNLNEYFTRINCQHYANNLTLIEKNNFFFRLLLYSVSSNFVKFHTFHLKLNILSYKQKCYTNL